MSATASLNDEPMALNERNKLLNAASRACKKSANERNKLLNAASRACKKSAPRGTLLLYDKLSINELVRRIRYNERRSSR